MKADSPATQSQIFSMLMDGKSAHSISLETCVNTSTITRLCKKHIPHIPVFSGGHPLKLSDTNIRHTSYLILSALAKQILLWMLPKHSPPSPLNLFPHKQLRDISKIMG